MDPADESHDSLKGDPAEADVLKVEGPLRR